MIYKRVYIRADGGSDIGLGHLVRCFALAQMLASDFEIHFVSRSCTGNFIDQLSSKGFLFSKIGDENDFFKMVLSDDIVVLDGYQFDSSYQLILTKLTGKLVCIDDLHSGDFYADLIINHAPNQVPTQYSAQPFTQFALGLDYALLRPPFLNRSIETESVKISDSVLICFGGSDSKDLTIQTLITVLSNDKVKTIFVVTGDAYSNVSELEAIITGNSNIFHYHAIDDFLMASLMRKSNVAIVPASGVLLEALCCNTIAISGMYVENQRLFYENYLKVGAFIDARDFSQEHLVNALDQSLVLQKKSFNGIDGMSGERLLKIFKQLVYEQRVHLRRANVNDLKQTYIWATNDVIRGFSFNKTTIGYQEHVNWFNSMITSPDCYYFIAIFEEKMIGSIRFNVRGDEATISYLVDPKWHNKGFGIILLKEGIKLFKKTKTSKVRHLVGYVMQENIASCKTFERLWFGHKIEDGNNKYYTTID